MDIGVFIPIGNNGWLISKNSPQYKPTFDLNKEIVLKAEHYGLDFALSMIKLRGFGGETEFWDYKNTHPSTHIQATGNPINQSEKLKP